jgi:putative transposase
MELTLQLQLLPDPEQATQLQATVERFNAACTWLAQQAFAQRLANKVLLQRQYYTDLRTRFGLSAQMAVRCIARVVGAYKRDKRLCSVFRPHAAMPYDQRLMSFKSVDRVSLLTLDGRILVPFVMGDYQRQRFTEAHRQCYLVFRDDGKWFLLVVVNLPDYTTLPATDFLGVDLGVVNLTTTSDGSSMSGEKIEQVRQRYHRRRQRLQQAASAATKRGKRPKQIRQALRRMHQRERRFRRDTNHILSKQLVKTAKDTERGLALEELTGIRDRTRFRKSQRAKIHGWSFGQLRAFIEYKARLSDVPVVLVDPRDTSKTCNVCGHCTKANRRSQAVFSCQRCGYTTHADVNGALNIRARARVKVPMVAASRHQQLLVALA